MIFTTSATIPHFYSHKKTQRIFQSASFCDLLFSLSFYVQHVIIQLFCPCQVLRKFFWSIQNIERSLPFFLCFPYADKSCCCCCGCKCWKGTFVNYKDDMNNGYPNKIQIWILGPKMSLNRVINLTEIMERAGRGMPFFVDFRPLLTKCHFQKSSNGTFCTYPFW